MGRSNLAFRKAHPHASSYHKFRKLKGGAEAAAAAAAAAEARRPRLASNAERYEEADEDGGADGASSARVEGRDFATLADEAGLRGTETFWRFRGEKEWDADDRPAPLALTLDYEAIGRNLRFLSLAERLNLEPEACLPEDLIRSEQPAPPVPVAPPAAPARVPAAPPAPAAQPAAQPAPPVRPAQPPAHPAAAAPAPARPGAPGPAAAPGALKAAAEDDDSFLDELLGPSAPPARPPPTSAAAPAPPPSAGVPAGPGAGKAQDLDSWLDEIVG